MAQVGTVECLTSCIQSLRILGLASAVPCLEDEVSALDVKDKESDSDASGSVALDHEGIDLRVLQVYRYLRHIEAFKTIEHIHDKLYAVQSVSPVVAAVRRSWITLRNLDPRSIAEIDLEPHANITSPVHRSITWAGAGVRGWWEESDGGCRPLHDTMEDVIYMPRSNQTLTAQDGKTLHVFCLADGHGGRAAAEWFVRRIPGKILSCFNSRATWQLNEPQEQGAMKEAMIKAFQELDHQFCEMRKSEYMEYTKNPGGHKPPDDGCTLNVVVLYAKQWILTAHVGDSRTIIGRSGTTRRNPTPSHDSPTPPSYTRWHITEDHTVSHPTKALFIQKAGGLFRESKSDPPITQPLPQNARTAIRCLSNARVFRPQEFINPYGFPVKHLGMGDAMGDVIMKIEPRLFQGVPDVHILELERKRGYLVVLGSDGLWGCLESRDADMAAERVLEAFGRAGRLEKVLDDRGDPRDVGGGFTPVGSVGAARLVNYVDALCARQCGGLKELFWTERRRMWDDVSVVVIEIEPSDVQPPLMELPLSSPKRASTRVLDVLTCLPNHDQSEGDMPSLPSESPVQVLPTLKRKLDDHDTSSSSK
ncbi:uncharacterized protein SPPG_01957 [Spizellomyces punctatus DAOM BR117]|uniref:PPM-type phosphatase domain-containing protein n=1 Tax=Spizellomyces punctatus (strain DAOM BR117) TaxID=645134 RepID=A0A0L0HN80_SPIPD|nr:uncharacterized protein SPPG_01957 [Spizellomyces punctatus DAOM BR117]KND02876.1 hypothetical protein SPPG_01957 [Spizellomyces punctatus DAOM BR117]|eukprot:XP_016610915.1 hypothetical protein SPPG_01957 [Spizellomyces punctatus DAOM BR117]